MTPARSCLPATLVVLACVLVPMTTAAGETGSPPAEIPADWWAQVQQEIRESEYRITWQRQPQLEDQPASWQAPNRAQRFRTYFTEQGIRVVPREERTPSWEWGLSLVGYGRGDRVLPVAAPSISVVENRVDYDRGEIVEWYVNEPPGLEQGFTLHDAPDVAGVDRFEPIHVALALSGNLSPSIDVDGQAIDFRSERGARVVRYDHLRVTDARGRELRAWMEGFVEAGVRGIRLVVEDEGADYPVTIDPVATGPVWVAIGGDPNARLGQSVATAGDVNGDGYSDVIVGADWYDNGDLDEGTVRVYHGSASGPSFVEDWKFESNQAEAHLGVSVATAGDVNGDGYSDVVVGSQWYDGAVTDSGRVWLFHGSHTGLVTGRPPWSVDGDRSGSRFGRSVAAAGDVNGDGFSDVIIGAWFYDATATEAGRAYVHHGSAQGLGVTPVWIVDGDLGGGRLGNSVATAGDINGDGYADVIVGAYTYDNTENNEGRAYVYHGSSSGLPATAAWIGEIGSATARFGQSVATAGDVNGDGYADVIIGASLYDNTETNEGAIFVYHGSSSGLTTSAAWTVEGGQQDARLGSSVATAGDVNGDGYADVIAGAYWHSSSYAHEGRASVYLGSASGLETAPEWTMTGGQEDAQCGTSVATAGDVNGDGYSDVIVGANLYDYFETDEGGAFVFLGSADGVSAEAGWTVEGGQEDAELGVSVASAGDVNGDGYADLIVGASLDGDEQYEGRAFVYHGSAEGPSTLAAWTAESNQAGARFGESVGTAGDVNGDGYADVIVGARGYNNGENYEGGAFVYHGAASGLSANPDWMAEGDRPSASFGDSVGTAGDVNGDGYADVIIGADFYDHGSGLEGAAFVYHGSASGLSSIPAWTGSCDQQSARFGGSVGTAGDVNGDSFSDVIVGAEYYELGDLAEGRAFVYHGSASGLSSTPAWTAVGGQYGASFGRSVATAGDVNGDGYADVIVGAPGYNNGDWGEGRAYVYHGSVSGLGGGAAWIVESDEYRAQLGTSVGTAGDVNGDGFADVIAGAANTDISAYGSAEGRAYVYHGSSVGLSTTPAWTADGQQVGATFGKSVAGGADVNGDGYADVIVGAPGHAPGINSNGLAQLFYGGGARGRTLLPRQRRVDDAAPIAPLGRSDAADAFRLALVGRTPYGRGEVKLEWEAKPPGTLFDTTATQQSSAWSDTGTAGIPLNEQATGLSPCTLYHWRVRLHYHPATSPFQQAGRWLTIPRNGWNEADLRTIDAADTDGDGLGDCLDNCPLVDNPDQIDTDGDAEGDACDLDDDNDGEDDEDDNCPLVYNPGQEDADLDHRGDACDNCPYVKNGDQNDCDGDGIGDVCDPETIDRDEDGIDDRPLSATCDNCPENFNPEQTDTDGDGTGDACDASVAITGWRLSDNGDDDGFADTNEQVQLYLTLYNRRAEDLTGLVAALATTDPKIECIVQPEIQVSELAARETRQLDQPFIFKVADVNRATVFEDFSASFTITMSADPAASDVTVVPESLTLDLDLDVEGGAGPDTFRERFEGTLGQFDVENLDQGIPGANHWEGLANGDGYRCQYNDPDWQNSNTYGTEEAETCYPGVTLAQADAVFWGTPLPWAYGARAFEGVASLRFGLDLGSLETITTPLAVLEAVRTRDPIHLGWDGIAPMLSFKHQASLMDSRGSNVSVGEAVDRGVVMVRLADDEGSPVGDWIKIEPHRNPYDQRGSDDFRACSFDPVDDGTNEDDFFDPSDPSRRLGPSSTCMPEYGMVHQGDTDYTHGFDPHRFGRAGDGPGLQGSYGPGTWVESRFDLSRFRGRQIRLRFLATSIKIQDYLTWRDFLTEDSANDDGWWIDDVVVTGVLEQPATVNVDTRLNPVDGDGDGLDGCGDCYDNHPDCTTDCTDADRDGLPACADDCDDTNPYCTTDCTDADGDGHCPPADCDDANPYCTTDCTDVDGDGYCSPHDCYDHSAACTTVCVDGDGDGVPACAGDCDDANPYCATDCTDDDGDTYCVGFDCDDDHAGCTSDCTDADGDGLAACAGDCDDAHPDCTSDCTDADVDGLAACAGDCDDTVASCTTDCTDSDGDGLAACAGDCDDSHPDCTTDCTDTDGDGVPDCADCADDNDRCSVDDCVDEDGDLWCLPQDCDDGHPLINPGQLEIPCDGLDNDCDGVDAGVIPMKLNPSLVTGGDVETDFRIYRDREYVVYRADQETNDVVELYSVNLLSGELRKLNAGLVSGGDVEEFETSFNWVVVYRADQDQNDVHELYASKMDGTPLEVKLSGGLASGGDVWDFKVDGYGEVLYRADQNQSGVLELFHTPDDTAGSWQQVSGPMNPDGDVQEYEFPLHGYSNGWVVYRADQETDGVFEVYRAYLPNQTWSKVNHELDPGEWVTSFDLGYARLAYGVYQTPGRWNILWSARIDDEAHTPFELSSSSTDQYSVTGIIVVWIAGFDLYRAYLTTGQELLLFDPSEGMTLDFVDNVNTVQVLFRWGGFGGSHPPRALLSRSIHGGDVGGFGDDVEDYAISEDGSRTVFRSDRDTPGSYELYSAPVEGGQVTKLSGPLPFDGSVVEFEIGPVRPYSSWVLYGADQETNDVFELYKVPIAGGSPVKLNAPLVVDGDVTDFVIDADGRWVVYRADQESNGVYELYRTCAMNCEDSDRDGYCDTIDCDDDDPNSKPGATEICDGLDNDCDGVVPATETDDDGDGLAECEGDCNDNDPDCVTGCEDGDGDGVRVCDGDCDDANERHWWNPGPIRDLRFTDHVTMQWQPPVEAGSARPLVYDVIRSKAPTMDAVATICLETDNGPDTTATDEELPDAGEVFFYLVRAENGCGEGPLGVTSEGIDRTAPPCP